MVMLMIVMATLVSGLLFYAGVGLVSLVLGCIQWMLNRINEPNEGD